jgi:hypothetical protein
MQVIQNDEQQIQGWLSRLTLPALAWAVLFVAFAAAGSMVSSQAARIAAEASVVSPMDTGAGADLAPVLAPVAAADPAVPDPATAEHEALDPVGAGHSTTP